MVQIGYSHLKTPLPVLPDPLKTPSNVTDLEEDKVEEPRKIPKAV
jgi:hypothetical protein